MNDLVYCVAAYFEHCLLTLFFSYASSIIVSVSRVFLSHVSRDFQTKFRCQAISIRVLVSFYLFDETEIVMVSFSARWKIICSALFRFLVGRENFHVYFCNGYDSYVFGSGTQALQNGLHEQPLKILIKPALKNFFYEQTIYARSCTNRRSFFVLSVNWLELLTFAGNSPTKYLTLLNVTIQNSRLTKPAISLLFFQRSIFCWTALLVFNMSVVISSLD